MLVFPTRCGSGFFMNTRGRNPLFHHLSSTCRSSSELDDGLTGADDGSAARAIHVEGTCSGSLKLVQTRLTDVTELTVYLLER